MKFKPTVQISINTRQAWTKALAWAHKAAEHAMSHQQLQTCITSAPKLANMPRLTTSGIHPHSTSPRQRNCTAPRRQARHDVIARVSVQPTLVIIFVGWTQWKRRKLYFSYETTVEKNFSLPTQLGEIFCGYLPRLRGWCPFVVLSPAWKVLRFGSEIFSCPPSPVRISHLVGRYVRFAEACFAFWFFLVACAGFSHQLVGHAGCICRELNLDR